MESRNIMSHYLYIINKITGLFWPRKITNQKNSNNSYMSRKLRLYSSSTLHHQPSNSSHPCPEKKAFFLENIAKNKDEKPESKCWKWFFTYMVVEDAENVQTRTKALPLIENRSIQREFPQFEIFQLHGSFNRDSFMRY